MKKNTPLYIIIAILISINIFLVLQSKTYERDKIEKEVEDKIEKVESVDAEAEYTFFVAGHVYGSHNGDYIGIYPSLKEELFYIGKYVDLEFGVFTGDVVREANTESWDAFDKDIEELTIDYHIAVGNHDMKDRGLYAKRYRETYYSFVKNNDLFIILDSNIDGWSILNEQRTFLENELTKSGQFNNIFIFIHHVIWWDEDNVFADIKVNSTAGRIGESNYWTEVEPLLKQSDRPVYIFAGDVGAFAGNPAFIMKEDENITYIASGMGGGEKDNIQLVSVGLDGNVSIDIAFIGTNSIRNVDEVEEERTNDEGVIVIQ